MKQYIRKADIILFVILVAAGLAATAVLALSGSNAGPGTKVVIESGGKLFASYSLSEDRTIEVPAPGASKAGSPDGNHDQYNIVKIEGGKVIVSEASCKNQVCVRHSAISDAGENIVCLPNRLVVSVEGSGEGGGYDSVTS